MSPRVAKSIKIIEYYLEADIDEDDGEDFTEYCRGICYGECNECRIRFICYTGTINLEPISNEHRSSSDSELLALAAFNDKSKYNLFLCGDICIEDLVLEENGV